MWIPEEVRVELYRIKSERLKDNPRITFDEILLDKFQKKRRKNDFWD